MKMMITKEDVLRQTHGAGLGQLPPVNVYFVPCLYMLFEKINLYLKLKERKKEGMKERKEARKSEQRLLDGEFTLRCASCEIS